MSQGDYINFRKVATILKRQDRLENVLSANEYTSFKSFELKNINTETIPCTRANKCTTFILMKDTQNRPNRVITMTDPMGKRGYTLQHGYNEYLVKKKVNNLIMPCQLLKECDEFLSCRRERWVRNNRLHNVTV